MLAHLIYFDVLVSSPQHYDSSAAVIQIFITDPLPSLPVIQDQWTLDKMLHSLTKTISHLFVFELPCH